MPQLVSITPLDGDTLDALLFRTFGLGPEALFPALEANPGLSHKVTLSRNDVVRLPPALIRPAPAQKRTKVQLWD